MSKAYVVGGGAAGFFLAITLKQMRPNAEVMILERSAKVLSKVLVSGGGRCNCTNTFEGVVDLSEVYPRGHRLLRKLFHAFGPSDARKWFEGQGVRLVAQSDHCVFPVSQDSRSIINCLTGLAQRLGVQLRTGVRLESPDELLDAGALVAVCTGGATRRAMLDWLGLPEADIVSPVPSLFTFSIADEGLRSLMGTVADSVTLSLAGHKFRASGPLLLTHWGVSGPATLRLSSYAARELAAAEYRAVLVINWLSQTEEQVIKDLKIVAEANGGKLVANARPERVSSRLWEYIAVRALADGAKKRWSEMGKKDFNRLVSTLTADSYHVGGRAPFKDEFVTAGGVALSAVSSSTLESKSKPRLFFAGEVLDVDGVTGGFNFQAAWTTAFVAAQAMAQKMG